MLIKDIINKIESIAPKSYAEQWDNVGLMIGDEESDVRNVLVALDVTSDVVRQAIDNKCGLIISHHPMFFDSIKAIDFSQPIGKMIKALIENNISVYSYHTNIDAAEGGINTALADLFKLNNIHILQENENNNDVGIGRIGELSTPLSVKELCDFTKNVLDTPFVRCVCKDENIIIKRLAVASGSCADLISLAKKKGAEAIITGDVKYHQALNSLDEDIVVIDAGHFPTEKIVLDIFRMLLKNLNVDVIKADIKDCFMVY